MNSPIKDKDFDMVSTLYHASQGASLCSQFSRDAESNSDQEAQEFFDRVASQYSDIAQEAKRLLKDKL
ncbi:hypothetical protein DQ400_06175 [Vreelandella sulfidaeris]|uniref:Uncharacterized protein n=1 Tax=Vreelandella sulfidaeris TaxID=115553 RepID=A0A365TRR1_9GAMM|nr:hypothetical protein [Halomonas sulfidaeris]RBI67977.1 hypothetical protein DQ400_06175 [Halomonas sulfidaeris]